MDTQTPRATGIPAQERPTSVVAALRSAHGHLREVLDATSAPPDDRDPRRAVRALDEAVSTLCVHLGAVETELEAAVRKHVPKGGALVRSGDPLARALQRTMRAAEQCLWGDARSGTGSAEDFADRLREQVEARCRHEQRLGAALDEAMSEDDRAALCARLPRAAQQSPTRPHPHRPHLGRLDPLVLRALGAWDDALDTMDVRVVHDRHPERAVPTPDRWSAYALGTGLASAEAAPVPDAVPAPEVEVPAARVAVPAPAAPRDDARNDARDDAQDDEPLDVDTEDHDAQDTGAAHDTAPHDTAPHDTAPQGAAAREDEAPGAR